MKKILTTTILIVAAYFSFAQTITNITVKQDGNNVIVSYKLTADSKCTINLYVSEDGGTTYTGPLTGVTGDVGKDISAGSKTITRDALKDIDYLIGDNIKFKITGKSSNTPEMVKITAGTFTMGASDLYYTEHKVTLSAYYIGKYEVTNAQFAEFIFDYGQSTTKSTSDYPNQTMIYTYKWGFSSTDPKGFENPSGLINAGYENYPVINVTWFGAYEYCEWLSTQTGETYSLPSEAQWEYAAGGGSTHQKWAGTTSETSLGTYAWYYSNSSSMTHKVGTKTANSLGLYDMSGNVWEWCFDWYNTYSSSAVTNPVNTTTSLRRVLRGGGCGDGATGCRVAFRGYYPIGFDNGIGFRVVRSL